MNTFTRSLVAAGLIGAAGLGLSGVANAEVVGDPGGVAGWTVQQAYDDCALMAAADAIGQMTGTAPDEEDIVAFAHGTPSVSQPGRPIYYSSDNPDEGGTVFADLPIVLSHYGVHGRHVDGASLGALQTALRDGGAVVVVLNAAAVQDGDGDRSAPDHAVVVTGVDTDAGVVHLNDSGPDTGADEQVGLATFTEAWQTSGNEMMVAT